MVLVEAQKIGNLLPTVLVPNLRGAVMAMDAGAKKITFVLSVSDSHNRANVRRGTDESLAMLREVVAERDNRQDITLVTALATSFGCSIEGAVNEAHVTQIAEFLANEGIDEINLADTVGYGDPMQVRRIFTDVKIAVGELPIAAHSHDTRGLGPANVMAALDAGVFRFDSVLGGLGGCPFAPGASGNIATEDTLHLFDHLGVDTGINPGALLEVHRHLAERLPEENWKDACLAPPRPTDNPGLMRSNRGKWLASAIEQFPHSRAVGDTRPVTIAKRCDIARP